MEKKTFNNFIIPFAFVSIEEKERFTLADCIVYHELLF